MLSAFLRMALMFSCCTAEIKAVVLDPANDSALAGFDGLALLDGKDQVFYDLGGIHGVNLRISLLEKSESISGLSPSSDTDGLYIGIDGTDAVPGESMGALRLRFDFESTGSETVRSFRVFQGNGAPWKLNGYEQVCLSSVQNGITFKAAADPNASIIDNGTSCVTIRGNKDPGIYDFEIASEGGTVANPVGSVDFRYYVGNRPSWNNNHLFSFEITTGNSEVGWKTIRNWTKWRDTDGNLIRAHGGCIFDNRFNGEAPASLQRIYWYGWDGVGAILCYSSLDLVTWTREQNSRSGSGNGYRPSVVYNASTDKYIMNVSPYGTFSSDAPNTEFGTHYGWHDDRIDGEYPRDSHTYQSGTNAYFACRGRGNPDGLSSEYYYTMNIYKLTPDYLNVELPALMKVDFQEPPTQEAPCLFQKNVNGTLHSYISCSGVWAWEPTPTYWRSAAGGFDQIDDSNSGMDWEVMNTEPYSVNSYMTQHDFIVGLRATDGSDRILYMYGGDRWSQKDPEAYGGKDDQFYFHWSPVSFDSAGIPTIHGQDEWEVNVHEGRWR